MIPGFLEEKLINQYGEKEAIEILDLYSVMRYTTLRVNTLKSSNLEVEIELRENQINYEKTSIFENAYILKNTSKTIIESLNIYKEGNTYAGI